MNSARVYLSGQNLLTIKSKSLTCSDPEIPTGIIRWLLPFHLAYNLVSNT